MGTAASSHPARRRMTRLTGAADGGPSCRFVLVADGAAPAASRVRMGRWLTAVRWPVDEMDDIVFAVSEAVSNAAEHAYPPDGSGRVAVSARIEDAAGIGSGPTRQVRVSVRDHGLWRTAPAGDEGRRRGLFLMAALMDDVSVSRGTDPHVGTEVAMISSSVVAGTRAQL